MKYEILNNSGQVINTIVADLSFVEQNFPGAFRAVVESKLTILSAESIRKERDKLLAECDWVVVKYLELGQAIPSEWTTYRQALRDVPQQPGFPEVTWPVKPS